MAWSNSRIIKPVRLFETNVGVNFSIKQKTGLAVGKGWSQPYMFYSYKELISTNRTFNGELVLRKVDSDTYRFDSIDGSVKNTSVVSVLITESSNTPETPKQSSGTWVTIDKISALYRSVRYVHLTPSNNHTFNINTLGIKKSFKVMFLPSKFRYLPACYHIKFNLENKGSGNYKVTFSQKYGDIQKETSMSSAVSGKQTVSIPKNYLSVNVVVKGAGDTGSSTMSLNINGSTKPFNILSSFAVNGVRMPFFISGETLLKDSTTNYVITTSPANYKYQYYTQFLETSGTLRPLNDFECYCVIYEDL